MARKRSRAGDDASRCNADPAHAAASTPVPRPAKRRRIASGDRSGPAATPEGSWKLSRGSADFISSLSDELFVRILSYLPLESLLAVAPVSRRFYQLAADSQLWKALYYARFVLPRAMRIPGFRESSGPGARSGERGTHKLHYTGRRALWADGKRGGLVRNLDATSRLGGDGMAGELQQEEDRGVVDWKRQYKIRHNWARGKCTVEELRLGPDATQARDHGDAPRMLVKVCEGIAITVDRAAGLKAWDLRTRDLLAQTSLWDGEEETTPTCIALDEQAFASRSLDIAVGFLDGSFSIWRLELGKKRMARRYHHRKSSNGALVGMAYSHPFLLTATESVLISLYTLEGPAKAQEAVPLAKTGAEGGDGADSARTVLPFKGLAEPGESAVLPPPYLLTSLRSHTSRPPLALSIRSLPSLTIASIAYTFSTRQGWSIGIQDLHITTPAARLAAVVPEVTTTRIAFTTPITSARPTVRQSDFPDASTVRRGATFAPVGAPFSARLQPQQQPSSKATEEGPTALCYTHPYLLATLPDNTLVLHLCTSTASALAISPGIRLWGHTSGISDAEITSRGKAVSVSCRGEELRVWELEGRPAAYRGRSVEVRASASGGDDGERAGPDWDERRNWVGFDDEMVIVLKESRDGTESLMVYDFT